MTDPTETARLAYLAACEEHGIDPVVSENTVLSIGREFLPPCAQAMLKNGTASTEYWHWLAAEVDAGAEETGL